MHVQLDASSYTLCPFHESTQSSEWILLYFGRFQEILDEYWESPKLPNLEADPEKVAI